MEFPVPQFIEMETKIVGPLTWRQFIFVGGAGTIIFFLYFIIKHFYLFLAIAFVLTVSSIGLAFVKIGGHPLPSVLMNFITYTLSSKLYIWKKKPIRAKLVYKKEKVRIKKEKPEEGPVLKVTGKSHLKELSTQVELKTK